MGLLIYLVNIKTITDTSVVSWLIFFTWAQAEAAFGHLVIVSKLEGSLCLLKTVDLGLHRVENNMLLVLVFLWFLLTLSLTYQTQVLLFKCRNNIQMVKFLSSVDLSSFKQQHIKEKKVADSSGFKYSPTLVRHFTNTQVHTMWVSYDCNNAAKSTCVVKIFL